MQEYNKKEELKIKYENNRLFTHSFRGHSDMVYTSQSWNRIGSDHYWCSHSARRTFIEDEVKLRMILMFSDIK